MKEKCFDKLSVFKKEKESFEEFEKLDELLLDDIEEAPGLGCKSPEVNKSVHNQSKTIASAPIEQTTLVNVIFVIIVLFIVIFCYSVKVIFFQNSLHWLLLSSKRNKYKFLAREWEIL